MDESTDLKLQIKQMIVDTLNLTSVTPEEIHDDKPLFTGENIITLDSIDGIELIMAIQRVFHVRLDDQNVARNILISVDSMAEFITTNKAS
jgi:acyl carrier protein